MHRGCRRDHSLPMPCGQYAPILSRKHGAPLCVQNFREPLYLRDKPVRVEDTRSEEERKYPELFRQKLQGAPRHSCTHGGQIGKLRTDVTSESSPFLIRKTPNVAAAGEGWSVPQSVQTVPIPGYNMPKDQSYRDL
jgi:hypothetical protein